MLAGKIQPKRFADRKDHDSIIKSSSNFVIRGHNSVSNTLLYFMGLLVVSLFVMLMYFATFVLDIPGQEEKALQITYSVFIGFFILVGYSIFIIARLKNVLNAVEFVVLAVSRGLENFSGAYCLMNKQGKIFYYNSAFFNKYVSSHDIERCNFTDIMNSTVFGSNALNTIKDSMYADKGIEVTLASGEKAQLVPLERPNNVFILTVN